MATTDFETRIRVKSHAAKSVGEIYSLWKSEQLCDLTLKVGAFEFKVHRLILVSCSKYFKNMFTEEKFIETGKNFVELFEIDVDSFKIILDYFYSGYIALTQSSVEHVLRTADFFGLAAIKSICYKYLLENIGVNNCIQRYLLGVKIGFKSLKSRTKSVIMQNLDEVSKTTEFLAINKDILKELLTSDRENQKAEALYNATMQWVMHDLDNRKSLLSELLVLIPTKEITYGFYIEKMKNNEILRQDLKCTTWMLDNFIERFVNVNLCASCSESSIFITSWDDKSPICYHFQLGSNELVSLPPRTDIIRFSAVYYKNWTYLIAGEINYQNIQSSFKYNTNCKCKWSEIDLKFERCNSGACILRDQLYLIGGYNWQNEIELKSCICYDFNSDRQYNIPDMKEILEVPGVCAYENSIYVSCGEGNKEMSIIQRFDPREGIWYEVGKYKLAKGMCSSSVISSSLYTSFLCGDVVERFDFRNNNSENLAKPAENDVKWITSVNGKLFGARADGLSEYDAENNQWLATECRFDLNCPIVVSWD